MQGISDEEIIKALVKSDRVCFEKVFKTCYPYVYKIAMIYLQNEEDTRDAVQIVMTKLWENGKSWNQSLPFKVFVRILTVNSCIDWLRKRKPSVSEELIAEQGLAVSDNVAVNVDYKEIIKFIESMDFPAKEVLKLHIIEGYSHAEIAALLGISEKYSRVVLSQAKKKIINNFSDEITVEKRLGS